MRPDLASNSLEFFSKARSPNSLQQAAKLYLVEQKQGSIAVKGTSIARDYSSHWTPVHLDVLVEDIEVALANAVGAGAILNGEINIYQWGKLAALRDPFGHGVCLLQFQGKGYDLVQD